MIQQDIYRQHASPHNTDHTDKPHAIQAANDSSSNGTKTEPEEGRIHLSKQQPHTYQGAHMYSHWQLSAARGAAWAGRQTLHVQAHGNSHMHTHIYFTFHHSYCCQTAEASLLAEQAGDVELTAHHACACKCNHTNSSPYCCTARLCTWKMRGRLAGTEQPWEGRGRWRWRCATASSSSSSGFGANNPKLEL
jgi:hypothetical protein